MKKNVLLMATGAAAEEPHHANTNTPARPPSPMSFDARDGSKSFRAAARTMRMSQGLHRTDLSRRRTLSSLAPSSDLVDGSDLVGTEMMPVRPELVKFDSPVVPEPPSGSVNVKNIASGEFLRQCWPASSYSIEVILDYLHAFLSIIFCLLYITESEITEMNSDLPPHITILGLWIAEVIIAFLFLLNYTFHFLHSGNEILSFLFSPQNLVELIVILPVVPLSFIVGNHSFMYSPAPHYFRVVYPIRFAHMYFCVDRVLRKSNLRITTIQRETIRTYFLIITVVLGACGVINVAETSDGSVHPHQTFFETLFYCILILGTIGYPTQNNSTVAQVFLGVFILVLVILVPILIADLYNLISTQTAFGGRFRSFFKSRYIVLCGNIEVKDLRALFREVFHPDHGEANINMHVVILSPSEPKGESRVFLHDPFYYKRVTFLNGSVASEEDLERAGVRDAQAVFVMGGKSRSGGDTAMMLDDVDTTMRTLALSRYTKVDNRAFYEGHQKQSSLTSWFSSSSLSVRVPTIIAQVNHPRNIERVLDAGARHVICVDELKLGLLARSCVVPGLTTMIYSLTHSHVEGSLIRALKNSGEREDSWLVEFFNGCDKELYTVKISPAFIGCLFLDMVRAVYNRYGVIIFALHIPEHEHHPKLDSFAHTSAHEVSGKVHLAPMKHAIFGDELAFVIAASRSSATLVTTWDEDSQGDVPSAVGLRNTTVHPHNYGSISVDTHPSDGGTGTPHSQHLHASTKVSGIIDAVKKSESGVVLKATSTIHLQIPTSETPEISAILNLTGHVVVCSLGMFPSSLAYFLAPLRSGSLTDPSKSFPTDPPVIILCPNSPSESEWDAISRFGGVHYVQGSPLYDDDLFAARVHLAAKTVVLSEREPVGGSSDGEDRMIDSASICAANAILAFLRVEGSTESDAFHSHTSNTPHDAVMRRLHQHYDSLPLVELLYTSNMKYVGPQVRNPQLVDPSLNPMETLEDLIYTPTPYFASGHVYSGALLDTMVVQTFYHGSILDVIRELIIGEEVREENDTDNGGKRILTGARTLIRQGCLPDSLAGATFAAVMNYFITRGALPIGIYRHRLKPLKSRLNEADVSLPYVYTCPDPATILHPRDRIFFVGVSDSLSN